MEALKVCNYKVVNTSLLSDLFSLQLSDSNLFVFTFEGKKYFNWKAKADFI